MDGRNPDALRLTVEPYDEQASDDISKLTGSRPGQPPCVTTRNGKVP